MSSLKRGRLAVLTLVAAALFSPMPAPAAGAIKLLPTEVEPSASGTVKWDKGRVISMSENGVFAPTTRESRARA
jgi:hypothetical protein